MHSLIHPLALVCGAEAANVAGQSSRRFGPPFLPVPAVAPYHLSFFCRLSKDNNFYTCFDGFFVCLCFDEFFECLCFDEFFAFTCLFGVGIVFLT